MLVKVFFLVLCIEKKKMRTNEFFKRIRKESIKRDAKMCVAIIEDSK